VERVARNVIPIQNQVSRMWQSGSAKRNLHRSYGRNRYQPAPLEGHAHQALQQTKVEVNVKRTSLLFLVAGSLALLSGCAAKVAPPIEKPGITFGADGSVTHRLCFTKDNSAVCVTKTRKPNGGTEIKIASEPLN